MIVEVPQGRDSFRALAAVQKVGNFCKSGVAPTHVKGNQCIEFILAKFDFYVITYILFVLCNNKKQK